MRLKKIISSVAVAGMMLASTVCSTTANAQGIYTINGTLAKYYQQHSLWCWAAAAETSAKHKVSSNKTQANAVYAVKHSYDNQSGDISEVAAAANYFVDYNSNYNYVGYYYAKNFTFLKAQVMSDKVPIIGGWEYIVDDHAYNNHATNVYMVIENTDGSRAVGYYDPAENNGGTHICTYESYCDGTYNGIAWHQTCYA
jgi:hypothetical protein